MVTVLRGSARCDLEDRIACFMIRVATWGWASHHPASSASVLNFGIAVSLFGILSF